MMALTMTIFTAAEIRAYARSLPTDQGRVEIRIMAAVITLFFIGGCIQPVWLLVTQAPTPLVRIMMVSQVPIGVATLFLLAALAALPHLWALVLHPEQLACKWPRKLATAGAALGSLLWIYVGNLSIPLDSPTLIYFLKSFGCAVFVGGVYAFSLNSQQVRQNEKPAVG